MSSSDIPLFFALLDFLVRLLVWVSVGKLQHQLLFLPRLPRSVSPFIFMNIAIGSVYSTFHCSNVLISYLNLVFCLFCHVFSLFFFVLGGKAASWVATYNRLALKLSVPKVSINLPYYLNYLNKGDWLLNHRCHTGVAGACSVSSLLFLMWFPLMKVSSK